MISFSFAYDTDTDKKSIQSTHVIERLLNWSSESSRLMVPDSSNRMISLAGSGFKTEEDHLNIELFISVCFNANIYLYAETYDLIKLYLRCTLQGRGANIKEKMFYFHLHI